MNNKTLLQTLTLGCSLSVFGSILGAFGWILDLAGNLLIQGLVLLGVCLGMWIWRKNWPWTGLTLFFILLGLIHLIPENPAFYTPTAAPPVSQETRVYRLLHFNVSSQNPRRQETLAYIQKQNADFVGLIEVNDAWEEALKPLTDQYHVKGDFPKVGNFGLALFSRFEFSAAKFAFAEITGVRSILASVQLQGRPLTLLLTHPYPPDLPETFHLRNRQLRAIGRARPQFNPDLIVLGDLNVTPWSAFFRHFLQRTRLKDSRTGFGLQVSWPSFFPRMLGIPIDHVLVSPGIRIHKREIGPHLGSDHRPVWVEFSLTTQVDVQ